MMMESDVTSRFHREWGGGDSKCRRVVEFLTDTYRRYCDEKLADKEFSKQLAGGNPAVYKQRLAEMLFADALWSDGFSLSSSDRGPDFLVEKNGEKVWMELITPQPEGIPSEYLAFPSEGVWDFPHKEILLRWTSAIDEKLCKLLGARDGKKRGYLADGIVKEDERYIVVVNDVMLVRWPDQMNGISQFPFPVEALMAVGPYEMKFDPGDSRKMISAGHQRRLTVEKPNGSPVPATAFFNPSNASVSAVMGITLREEVILGRPHRNVLAYNPLAKNPLPPKMITSQEHWVCDVFPDRYIIRRLDDEPFRSNLGCK
jgi:type I restriction enzyme S subunit